MAVTLKPFYMQNSKGSGISYDLLLIFFLCTTQEEKTQEKSNCPNKLFSFMINLILYSSFPSSFCYQYLLLITQFFIKYHLF